MKKTINLKLTACFMALLLLLTSVSAGFVSACPEVEIYSYDDFEYEIMTDYDDDYNEYQYICIISYTGNSAHVEIPPAIDNLPVTTISYAAFSGNESITSVCVPSSVTYIADTAFNGCTNLSEISLPSTLTFIGDDILKDTAYAAENYEDGLLYCGQYLLDADHSLLSEKVTVKEDTTLISAYAFYSCDITSINLPSSLRKINDYAFAYCEKLTSVNIAEGVEEFGYGIFSDCYSLAEISLPSSLKLIGAYCFGDCKKLTALELPENMERIPDGLLYGCESITSFDINDNISSIGYESFAGSGIKSLHIPASVNFMMSIGSCPQLSTITVDSDNKWYFAENNVLFEKSFVNGNISIVFIANNESLENFVIPDSVKRIDFNALAGNKKIKSLTIGKNLSQFYDFEAPNLENIYVHPENTTFSSVDGVLLSDNGTTLEFYPMGKTDEKYTVPAGVNKLDSGCFKNNPYLTELTIPDTVKELNHTVVESCENLTTINMGPCEASYFWPILFCNNLTTINFSGTTAQWEAMDIDVYNEDNKAGLYAYCTDGTITLEEPEYDYDFGDVNMDGKLNIRDATAIQKHIAKIATLSKEALFFADYNFDGKISIQDATEIQKFIANF